MVNTFAVDVSPQNFYLHEAACYLEIEQYNQKKTNRKNEEIIQLLKEKVDALKSENEKSIAIQNLLLQKLQAQKITEITAENVNDYDMPRMIAVAVLIAPHFILPIIFVSLAENAYLYGFSFEYWNDQKGTWTCSTIDSSGKILSHLAGWKGEYHYR
jgi:hypothetical protein